MGLTSTRCSHITCITFCINNKKESFSIVGHGLIPTEVKRGLWWGVERDT